MNKLNLINLKFGKLTVLNEVPSKNNKTRWNCKCECGNTKIVNTACLKRGYTTSCGCNLNITYQKYGEIPRFLWKSIVSGAKRRNLKCDITVSYIWFLFLEQNKKCYLSGTPLYFSKTRSGARDKQTASLDRIDSSKGYEIGNVMWIHKKLQVVKSNLELYELIGWCRKIANKHQLILSNSNSSQYFSDINLFEKQLIQNTADYLCPENFKGINI